LTWISTIRLFLVSRWKHSGKPCPPFLLAQHTSLQNTRRNSFTCIVGAASIPAKRRSLESVLRSLLYKRLIRRRCTFSIKRYLPHRVWPLSARIVLHWLAWYENSGGS